jgi:hypothetical protein
MTETKYYTIPSCQDYQDDDGYPRSENDNHQVFAMAIKENKGKNILQRNPNHFRYYVKIEPNKSLHNPFGGHSVPVKNKSFIDRVCKVENTFMEVNQSVFNKYINFLKTQNNKWFTDASREIK